MSSLLVLCTVPDEARGRDLAQALLERRLAACVSRLPGLHSTYRWQGRVEESQEVLLLIKTARDRFAALRETVAELHPYDVPELLAFEAADGLAAYLTWIHESTRPGAA